MINSFTFAYKNVYVKKRPRLNTKTGHVYNPNQKEEETLKSRIRQHILPVLQSPIETAVKLDCTFWIPYPKSWSNKQKYFRYKLTRPDIDNYYKFVLDVLNGIVYLDDKQVVELTGSKHYYSEERTIIKIFLL